MKDLTDKFREILAEIEAEKGPFFFAALIERDNTPGRRDLVVSAPWISDEYEFYKYLSPKLHNHLTKEDWFVYSRTEAIDPTDRFIQEFTRYVGPIAKEQNLLNFRIANVDMKYAHLFPTNAENFSYA
jgi:hypothetical protein